jgi:hypothetical protein
MEETINIVLVIIGGLVFFLGLISEVIKRLNFSEPIAALVLGVLLSSAVYGIFDLDIWNHRLLEEVARLAVAVGVMGVALRVPSSYTKEHWRSVVMMLVITMPFQMDCQQFAHVLDYRLWVYRIPAYRSYCNSNRPHTYFIRSKREAGRKKPPWKIKALSFDRSRFQRRSGLPFCSSSYSIDDSQAC